MWSQNVVITDPEAEKTAESDKHDIEQNYSVGVVRQCDLVLVVCCELSEQDKTRSDSCQVLDCLHENDVCSTVELILALRSLLFKSLSSLKGHFKLR